MTARRILLGALLSLSAAACGKREPDFDKRYDAASARISQAARDIDAQIAATGAPAPAERADATR